ncbi:hypothetical protein ACROYT_G012498 [Oculina patagonica]
MAEATEATTTAEATEESTTAEVTEEPTTAEATEALPTGPPCKGALDLGIIFDKSKSVGKRNLRKLKQSLTKFVDKFEVSEEGTHVGMISFNDDAELLFDFKDNRYHSNKQLKKRIAKIPVKLQQQTRTDLALTLAKKKLFTKAGGDRSDVPNALIIFTDGKSTAKPWQKGYVPLSDTVGILTEVGIHPDTVGILTGDKDVYTYAVGIGRKIRERELAQLAGDKGDYSRVGDFDHLNTILETLKTSTCAHSGTSPTDHMNGETGYRRSAFGRRYDDKYPSPIERFLDTRFMR